MYRIDNSTAATVMPTPGAVGPRPNGYFKQRSATESGTVISVDWLNSIQEEVSYAIEQTGATLDKTDQTQLYTAIQTMIASFIPSALTGTLDVLTYSIISTSGDIVINPNSGFTDLRGIVYVQDEIRFKATPTTKIIFGSGTFGFNIAGSSIADLTSAGLRLGGANARVTTILDEDDMASDSATALITQQSAKAYADVVAGDIAQYLSGFTFDNIAGGSTAYFALGTSTASVAGGSAATYVYCFAAQITGTLQNLHVEVGLSAGGSDTYTCTIYVNGSATALTCTLAASDFNKSDLTHTVAITAGDQICLEFVASATATTTHGIQWNALLTP